MAEETKLRADAELEKGSRSDQDVITPPVAPRSVDQETASPDPTNSPVRPERTITGFRWVLVCFGVLSANALYGLDTTIVADIQAAVAESFNNVAQLGWLGVGFTLGSTVAILPLGKSFGIFDTKWLFIGCLTLFAAMSALCGAAPTMQAMIVGRVFAGAGGAGMYLGTINLFISLCSAKEQPFYLSLIGFVYGGGCILGPLVGGAFTDSDATWRWAFYLNLVIFAVAAPIYVFLLPSLPKRPDTTWTQKLRGLDWLGIALSAGLWICFTLAFSFGGIIWAWDDGRTIALIVLFGTFTICLVATQYFSLFTNKIDRIFPCDLLTNPQLIIQYICLAAGGGASMFVSVYYIPLYFLFVYGDSGTQAAVRLLPFICFYVAGVLLCGAILGRTGYHILWYITAGLCLTAGGAAMYTVRVHTPTANIIGYSVLLGVGQVTSMAPYNLVNLLVRSDRAAEAIQFLNIAQGSSQLMGLAVASLIFQTGTFSGLKAVFDGIGYTDEEIRAAVAGARSAVLQQASPELRDRAMEVIVHNINNVWLMVVAAGALHTVCSMFLTRTRFVHPVE
ncbi:major facilitator superfamily domain-containing protein [Apodospora peruviana]|uniref:Major facilitator superfamily domain-containing protein n=1 Tax=Apodospora peruviana TaxID=516989 RepID=A0AAE0HXM4_9PEZI|nr:major facilitator superfamily domain-containing protein [Apodospora peruviana]